MNLIGEKKGFYVCILCHTFYLKIHIFYIFLMNLINQFSSNNNDNLITSEYPIVN